MTTVLLPWPPKELWPNRRAHFHAKARIAKAYRADCAWLTKHAEPAIPDEGPIALAITFRPPDRRARDLDNMLAAIKPHLDGVADALHVNDKRFEIRLARGEPHKGGCVEIGIQPPT